MDPADLDALWAALTKQGSIFGYHQHEIVAVHQGMTSITEVLWRLSSQMERLQASISSQLAPAPVSSPAVPALEFCTLSAAVYWNASVLYDTFFQGKIALFWIRSFLITSQRVWMVWWTLQVRCTPVYAKIIWEEALGLSIWLSTLCLRLPLLLNLSPCNYAEPRWLQKKEGATMRPGLAITVEGLDT